MTLETPQACSKVLPGRQNQRKMEEFAAHFEPEGGEYFHPEYHLVDF